MEGIKDMTTLKEIAAGRKLPASQGGSLPEPTEPSEPTEPKPVAEAEAAPEPEPEPKT